MFPLQFLCYHGNKNLAYSLFPLTFRRPGVSYLVNIVDIQGIQGLAHLGLLYFLFLFFSLFFSWLVLQPCSYFQLYLIDGLTTSECDGKYELLLVIRLFFMPWCLFLPCPLKSIRSSVKSFSDLDQGKSPVKSLSNVILQVSFQKMMAVSFFYLNFFI